MTALLLIFMCQYDCGHIAETLLIIPHFVTHRVPGFHQISFRKVLFTALKPIASICISVASNLEFLEDISVSVTSC